MAHGRTRLTLIALAAIVVTSSAASPPTAAAARHTTGTGGSLNAMMSAATGYTPSQVAAQPICNAPSPGQAACDAVALVSKSTGAPVRPLKSVLNAAAVGSAVTSPHTVQAATPFLTTPGYLQEAYDTGWLSATAGVGRTVAIIDAYGDNTAVSDLATFRSKYGLPVLSTCAPASIATHSSGGPCLTVVSQTGSTTSLPAQNSSNPWEPEMSLDLDAVSSLCPNCNILFIEAKSAAINNLAAGDAEALKLGVKLISNSFGGVGAGDGNYYSTIEAATGDQAGAETFASTGDDGAYVDGAYQGQTNADQVPYPASEPGITAVGGTSIAPAANARGVTESVWSSNGAAGSACSQFDTQPSWQASVNTGCSGRAVADVSADADPDTGLAIYDSYEGGWVTYGGTSLAAPLTAAYVALTGINSSSTANSDGSLSAEWAYADASELNDITSGSSGSGCSSSISYAKPQICAAGTGWDGPTGVGSISGDVIASSAGPSLTVPPTGGVDNGGNGYSIVQSLSGTTATFDGGAYPNGSATSVWWEYGTSGVTADGTNFSSATSTSSQSVGSGTAAVAATPAAVTGLSAGAVYYAEECASNNGASDTTCGNVTEFTTGAGPTASGAPTITATGLGNGGQLSLSISPTWTSASSLTYQWQESSDASTWSNLGATATSPDSYTLQPSDSQQYLRLEVRAANGSGTTTVYSNILQALLMPPVATGSTAITASGLGLGGVLSIGTAPSWSGALSVTDQWQESTDGNSWTNISGATASAYTIALSDSQLYIRLAVIASNSGGSSTAASNVVQVDDLASGGTGGATSGSSGSAQSGSQSQTVTISRAPSVSGASTVGGTIAVGGGSYENAGAVTVTFDRCAHTCTVVQSGSSTNYKLRASDAGYYVITIVKVAGTAGTASATTRAAGVIGPVTSGTAGALRISSAVGTVRSGAGKALGRVKRVVIKPKLKTKPSTYVLTLTRAAGVKGSIRAWVCVQAGGSLVSCSRAVPVAATAKIRTSVPAGDRVELVAVRGGA